MRDYCGVQFGGIAIERNTIHVGADGRRYLVIHGDEFDVVVRYAKWLALLGDWSYELALWANTHFNVLRRWFGMPYWSLSAYLKHKVKRAVNYIGEFETALAQEARRHGAQGVICGHIHHAAMRQVGDVIYINTGDWVESCTAVAETEEGTVRDHPLDAHAPGHEFARSPCRGARGCRLMRVLVATDAWHPQVNGVVRTYERLALEAPKQGCEVSFLAPTAFPHAALSHLSGDQTVARQPRRDLPPCRCGAPRFHPYRHGGTDRAHDEALLPQDASAVHHELSHALSRICLGAAADPRGLVLRAATALPQRRRRHLRRHASRSPTISPRAASSG